MTRLTELVFLCLWITSILNAIGSAHEDNRRYFDTTQDVSLTATPHDMYSGFTKDLSLTCNFATHLDSDFSSLHALILSKSDLSSGKYRELAILTSLPNDHVENRVSLGAKVTGGRTANNQSFISYKWIWPDQEAGGHYFCEAHGFTNKGHPRMSTATVEVVTKETLDNGIIAQTIKELDSRLDNCTVHGEQQTARINSLMASQEELKNSLKLSSQIIKYLNASVDVGVTNWRGHTYFLSQSIMTSVRGAQEVCQQLGGYLLEIDDTDEFYFATDFIKQVDKDSDSVAVGSWDVSHEGRWTFMRSERPMTTFHWAPSNPSNGFNSQNCLFIYWGQTKEMDDDFCNFGEHYNAKRCMCEIPEIGE